MISEKAKLPELPRINIEIQLLTVINEILKTQLDAQHLGIPFEPGIITACNNILGRYSGKLDMITSGEHIIEM